MRVFLALFTVVLAASAPAYAQSCTGLACQQVTCPGTGTTTVTGTVTAPNATDPLPNVLVFVPNATLPPLNTGSVECVLPSTPPGGSPLVGTISASDGTFTVSNMPVGTSIPLVIQAGRWRRKIVIPTVTACTNTAVGLVSFPTVQTAADTDDNIPLIAVATGNIDPGECVLRKVGIADSQFSDPGGSGRIQFFTGTRSAGAEIDASTPTEDTLMGNPTGTPALNNYDMVMFPCQGGVSNSISTASYTNLQSYVNSGGRVFATHWSEGWLNNNSGGSGSATATSPFQGVVTWSNGATIGNNQSAIINTTGFSDAFTLAQWLQNVGAGTTFGQIQLNSTFENVTAVNPPTQEWMTLNSVTGDPIMQFSFDTPVGSPAANQCGRVLYNDYHVETTVTSASKTAFPNECNTTAMTPQEKVLEYSLFALTAEGNAATLTPATQDFGSKFVTFTSAPQTFTWTNQAVFPATVGLLTASGDFSVTGNNCTNVAAGASCQITVVFTPTAVGSRTGTLTVGAPGSTLTSTLTGTGLSPFSVSTASMNFPGVIIGATLSQTFSLVNNASISFPLPTFTITGDYTDTTACPNIVPANSSCLITVTFAPVALGLRSGTLTVNAPGNPLPVALTGVGLPSFTISAPSVTFGNVDVGGSASQTITLANVAPVPFPLPTLPITGDYSTTTNCPSTMPANSSCLITVIFTPTATGARTGTLTVTYGAGTLPVTLSGNGVDFSLALNPSSGGIIAGYSISSVLTATPISGFDAPITLSCSSAAQGSVCGIANPAFLLSAVATVSIDITTTSKYTVIGYGGLGAGWLWLIALGSGLLVWTARRSTARFGVIMVLLVGALSLTGCSGKLPGVNSVYTAPGANTYTLTATDGTITHSVTYTLNVSAK